MNEIKEYAEKLVSLGLSVTPVKDKRPFIDKWSTILDEEILDQKYDYHWKTSNGLGLILGEASGIICLDIDILSGDQRLKAFSEELQKRLPPVYCGLSGNPTKPVARLFRYSGERSEKFLSLNVEILSNGNQKVIPPSIHPETKKPYAWTGKAIDQCDLDELPHLPSDIIEFLREQNEKMKSGDSNAVDVPLTKGDGRSSHGSHNALSKKGLQLYHAGFLFENIVDELLAYDEEINEKSDVVYFLCPSRKEFRSKNARVNAQQFVAEIIYRNASKKFDSDSFFAQELACGFTKKEEKPERIIRKHISLYSYLKHKSDIWYCPEIRSFQVWDGKKYNIKHEDFVKKFAQDHFNNPPCTSISEKNTFVDYAKNSQQTSAGDFLLRDTGLINLQNGVFDINKKVLVPHDKKHRLPYLIDVPYGNETEAPNWEAFLNLITMNRSHMADVIEEFIGYAVSACNYDKFNKILILDGAGANGKSTLIRAIQTLVGQENTSAVSLESITKERFAGFSLVNKLINFCSEEPKEAFTNTGILKKLTGGDSFMVEEKHKGAFLYNNIAKFVISYNKMPFFPDDSAGMRRRIILIPCELDLEKKPELKIEKVNEKISKEKPAILRRCIDAYLKVLERGYFTEIAEGKARLEEMITESNPLLDFIAERVEITGRVEDRIKVAAFWKNFDQFTGGKTLFHKNSFAKRLKATMNNFENVKYVRDFVHGRHYTGVRMLFVGEDDD